MKDYVNMRTIIALTLAALLCLCVLKVKEASAMNVDPVIIATVTPSVPSAEEIYHDVITPETVMEDAPTLAFPMPVVEYLDVETGVTKHQFTASNGIKVPFNLYVPEGATTDMPMIIWLHGMGYLNRELPENYGVIQMVQELCDNRFIVVQPTASYGWHVSKQFNAVMEMTDYIVSEYQIDDDRIILTGHSLGSLGTWYYAEAAHDRWAAVAPVANRCVNALKVLPESDLPVWAFSGTGDTKENINGQQRTVDSFLKINPDRDVQHTVLKGSHNDMAEAPYTVEFFDWAAEQVR